MFIKEFTDEQLLELKMKYNELVYNRLTKSDSAWIEILGFVTVEINDQAPRCVEINGNLYVKLAKYTTAANVYHYLIAQNCTIRITSDEAEYIKCGNFFTAYDFIDPSQITVNPEGKP